MRHFISFSTPYLCAALLLAVVGGCSSESSNTPGATAGMNTEQALMNDWRALQESEEDVLVHRFEIAGRLALFGPQAFDPLFDIVADANAPVHHKVQVLQVMMTYGHPSHFDRLRQLAESEDVTTQTIAVHLAAYTRHEDARAFLEEQAENATGNVRFAALQGLVVMGDEEAAETFIALYHDSETPDLQKEEIVRVILGQWKPRETDILMDAVVQPWMSSDLRGLIAETLGQNGVVDAIEPLQASLSVDDDSKYQAKARAAIAALEEIEPVG
jgi:HEAT repeat protein